MDGAEKVAVINAEIATAFCSIAEIYLTDLCDDEGMLDLGLTWTMSHPPSLHPSIPPSPRIQPKKVKKRKGGEGGLGAVAEAAHVVRAPLSRMCPRQPGAHRMPERARGRHPNNWDGKGLNLPVRTIALMASFTNDDPILRPRKHPKKRAGVRRAGRVGSAGWTAGMHI